MELLLYVILPSAALGALADHYLEAKVRSWIARIEDKVEKAMGDLKK
jgi:hypothetical protein